MTTHHGTQRPTGERVEVYKASDGFRWRFFAANGAEESGSSEGYEHKGHALDQAIARHTGVRVFEPGADTDGGPDAADWIEVETA